LASRGDSVEKLKVAPEAKEAASSRTTPMSRSLVTQRTNRHDESCK
jgi:hypothetical protein